MAPKAVNALAALQPESALSRAWPAPTENAWPIPTAGGTSAALVGGAHGPESGERTRNVPTGTDAFAGMARSYKTRGPFPQRVAHPPPL